MDIIRNIKISTFKKELEFKFNSLFREESFEIVRDLAGQIDFYFEFIDDGSQWKAAKQRNRKISLELFELGCVAISYPFENRMIPIDTKTYCK